MHFTVIFSCNISVSYCNEDAFVFKWCLRWETEGTNIVERMMGVKRKGWLAVKLIWRKREKETLESEWETDREREAEGGETETKQVGAPFIFSCLCLFLLNCCEIMVSQRCKLYII